MFGLDRHIINDENSRMSWNHKHYPFDAWNKEQDLNTAMQNSVNWYFERISLSNTKELYCDSTQAIKLW